jgi:hypothetical protein
MGGAVPKRTSYPLACLWTDPLGSIRGAATYTHTGKKNSRGVFRAASAYPGPPEIWCFQIASRKAFTRFVGFAYDATFTDDAR